VNIFVLSFSILHLPHSQSLLNVGSTQTLTVICSQLFEVEGKEVHMLLQYGIYTFYLFFVLAFFYDLDDLLWIKLSFFISFIVFVLC
jgi:hypothetical protein